MNHAKLTAICAPATSVFNRFQGHGMRMRLAKAGIAVAGAAALGGCINVTAPDEPIVIQLDINIRAEVLYRLAEDASNTIEENADIF